MGADGGCKISRLIDIKKDWREIKNGLIDRAKKAVNRIGQSSNPDWNDSYNLNTYKEMAQIVGRYPDSIDDLSVQEVVDLFKFFESCDCPCAFDDYIITGSGDNVAEFMEILSCHLPGMYVETWT